MTDETQHETTTDKPLEHLADAEQASEPADETRSAKDRLRAFEDEHLGADAVRINGRVERGSGSPFQKLSDEHKRQYAAIERLVAAERKVDDARAALAVAESERNTAQADTEPKPDAAASE